jgi:hypothetical protein
MTISKSKHAPIRWNGEEQRGMLNAGTYNGILVNQFAQAFRALVNQIEVDLFTDHVPERVARLRHRRHRAVRHRRRPVRHRPGSQDPGRQRRAADRPADRARLGRDGQPARQAVGAVQGERGRHRPAAARGHLGRLEGFDVHNSARWRWSPRAPAPRYVTSGSTAPGVTVDRAGDRHRHGAPATW